MTLGLPSTSAGPTHGRNTRACFACGEPGHIKRFCPTVAAKKAAFAARSGVPQQQQQQAPAALTQAVVVQHQSAQPRLPTAYYAATPPHPPLSPSTTNTTSASDGSFGFGGSSAASMVSAHMTRVRSSSTLGTRTSSWASLDSYSAPSEGTPEGSFTQELAAPPTPPKPQPQHTDSDGYFVPTAGLVLNRRYRVLGQLGTGTFATVVSAEDLSQVGSNRYVAVKVIRAEHNALADAADEIRIMSGINAAFSRNIEAASGVSLLLGTFSFDRHKCLVQPLYGASLFADLKERHYAGLPWQEVVQIARSSLCAVTKLHMIGLIHCDLKPENILRTHQKSTHTTVVDFGCSYKDTDKKPRLIQTLYYRAPEVILSSGVWSFPADMWSMGCILYELLTGQPLFRVAGEMSHLHAIQDVLESDIPRNMMKGSTSPLVDAETLSLVDQPKHVPQQTLVSVLTDLGVPSELTDLLLGLLRIDPAERLKAHEALNHPVFHSL
eukprot:Rhum_TRINITY_DN15221_c4_g2::Rhum_TRINITY_DN15221_c4_g2_i1::g.143720::m.143720/K08287/E2.7.12.1; dual-specificity kinase